MAGDDLGLGYWRSQRVSRRKVLAGAAVGGAAVGAIAIVGCGGSSNKTNVDHPYADGRCPGQP